MIQENEITMLVMGISVLVLVLFNLKLIKRFPSWPRLLTAFVFALTAWCCTVLENFFLPNMMNIIEHLSYATSSFFLVFWCASYTMKYQGDRP